MTLHPPRHRKLRTLLSSLALVCGLGFQIAQARTEAATAPAQTEPVVKAELIQLQVLQENGKEILKPVQTVKPGDLIEYKVTYTNRGTKPVRDVVAQLPIPEGLEYQPRSARPAPTAEASVKNGAFAREPLMRDAAGGKKEPVPYSEYRQLRWTLGQIAAGARTEVSARARVSVGVPANLSSNQTAAQTAGAR
ncbi:MAG: hypothetical protein ACKOWC_08945 [Limnohabitans sp.]